MALFLARTARSRSHEEPWVGLLVCEAGLAGLAGPRRSCAQSRWHCIRKDGCGPRKVVLHYQTGFDLTTHDPPCARCRKRLALVYGRSGHHLQCNLPTLRLTTTSSSSSTSSPSPTRQTSQPNGRQPAAYPASSRLQSPLCAHGCWLMSLMPTRTHSNRLLIPSRRRSLSTFLDSSPTRQTSIHVSSCLPNGANAPSNSFGSSRTSPAQIPFSTSSVSSTIRTPRLHMLLLFVGSTFPRSLASLMIPASPSLPHALASSG